MMDQSVMYFAGTAARSSAIATPTTGMTSYIGVTGTATIPQIETYTGSAWQTPYGMTLVNTTTFTTATSVSINNVFNTNYAHYRIVFDTAMSTATNLSLRFRSAGSDISTTNYFWHFASTISGGSGYGTAGFGNSQTSFIMTQADVATPVAGSFDIFNPYVALNKRFNGIVTYGSSVNHQGGQAFCGVNTTALYDGLTLFMPTGTITGNIRIYGYRNS
jgi:hypothetical protein